MRAAVTLEEISGMPDWGLRDRLGMIPFQQITAGPISAETQQNHVAN